MNELIQLIATLKPLEIQWINQYYNLKSTKDADKRLKLFRLLLNKKITSNKDAYMALYGRSSQSALSQLKRRLRHDILELLVMHQSMRSGGIAKVKAVNECQVTLTQARLLIERQLPDLAQNLLEKALQTAIELELFDQQIQILNLLRDEIFIENSGETQAAEAKISYALYQLEQVMAAKRTAGKQDNKKLLSTGGQDIIAQSNPSKITELLRHFRNAEAALLNQEYEKVSFLARTCEEILEQYPTLQANQNIIRSKSLLAISMVQMGQRSACQPMLEKLYELFAQSSLIGVTMLERLFLALLGVDDISEARKLLELVISHPKLQGNEEHFGKWKFFESALLFKNSNYNSSLKLIRAHSGVLRKFPDWQLGYSIMEVINLIDKGDEIGVCYRYEAFKKLIQRKKSQLNSSIYNRCVQIEKILRVLIRNNFCFKATLDSASAPLEVLKGESESYAWNPFGAELIRFDAWFESKSTQVA